MVEKKRFAELLPSPSGVLTLRSRSVGQRPSTSDTVPSNPLIPRIDVSEDSAPLVEPSSVKKSGSDQEEKNSTNNNDKKNKNNIGLSPGQAKWLGLALMFLTSCCYYLQRKTLAFAKPALAQELHLEKPHFGTLLSSFAFAYAISKFVVGVLCDMYSPKMIYLGGLLGASLAHIVFGLTTDFHVMLVAWTLNGFFQGSTWPPCVCFLKAWFKPNEIGFWWSFLSTSMNVANGIAPIVVSLLSHFGGWSAAFTFVGLQSIAWIVVGHLLIAEKPKGVAWNQAERPAQSPLSATSTPTLPRKHPETIPPIPAVHQSGNSSLDSSTKDYARLPKASAKFSAGPFSSSESMAASGALRSSSSYDAWMELFTNVFLIVIIVIYFFLNLIKMGISDWGQMYLMEEKGRSLFVASGSMSVFEIGGIIGSLAAGLVSDRLLRFFAQPIGGMGRIPVTIALNVLFGISLFCFRTLTDASSSPLIDNACIAVVGFCAYGLSCLYGLMTIEAVAPYISGRCSAFVGLMTQGGSLAAGYPLSYAIDRFGWNCSFQLFELFIAGSLVANMLVFLYYTKGKIFAPPSPSEKPKQA